MTTDTAVAGINVALADLQTQLPRITKDLTAKVKSERTGAQYSYSYADLAQISRELLPIMGKLGLAFTSRPTMQDGKFVLVYELRHISGESISGVYPLPGGGTPQDVGSAITYARRYCLCAVTGVAPDDDDNDAVLAERAARRHERREPRPQQQTSGGKESPITADQQRRMQKAFQELGLVERDRKVQYASKVVERTLTSSTELTQFEAGRVIKQAERDLAQRKAKTQQTGDEADWPEAAKPADARDSR